ncbi:MAG: hypothetical protein VB050_14590 [Geobacteraceae bacterium]|nr:hypothetical protein [Geobacteraceae bacterium]
MADNPQSTLTFLGRCPDCAERKVELPSPLPLPGDDFDWLARDFDSFRRLMLEELAARYPERTRWTAGDLEVVLVEELAAVLDQLSDMADRVAMEGYLETARRPESVRRLLALIGYDAATAAGLEDDPPGDPDGKTRQRKLEELWRRNPHLMEPARRAGPRAIHTQRRMVTVEDYADRLADHPLVLRACAWSAWTGSWPTIRVATILWNDHVLDQEGLPYPDDLRERVEAFHRGHRFWEPVWEPGPPTIRTLLRPCLEAWRMAGQEVVLEDAEPVGIKMFISVRVSENYFQSEVRNAVIQAMGTGPGGFFEPGRLNFGQELYASDVFQTLMSLDGVENVCLNRFKRFGDQYPDRTDTGRIPLEGLEIAVCDNNPGRPERGYINLTLNGGRRG